MAGPATCINNPPDANNRLVMSIFGTESTLYIITKLRRASALIMIIKPMSRELLFGVPDWKKDKMVCII